MKQIFILVFGITTLISCTKNHSDVSYPYTNGAGNNWTFHQSAKGYINITVGKIYSDTDVHHNLIAYAPITLKCVGSFVSYPNNLRVILTDSKGMIQGDDSAGFGTWDYYSAMYMKIQVTDTTITIKKAVAEILN